MRRDMDLIRRMLIDCADSPGPVDASVWVTDSRPMAVVGYHVQLLSESGLAVCSVFSADGDPYYRCSVDRLTWSGQDFLAAVADDGIWSQVKRRVSATVGTVAADTLKALAVRLAADVLGL